MVKQCMGSHLNIVKNDFFDLPSDTHFAVAVHSIQYIYVHNHWAIDNHLFMIKLQKIAL